MPNVDVEESTEKLVIGVGAFGCWQKPCDASAIAVFTASVNESQVKQV